MICERNGLDVKATCVTRSRDSRQKYSGLVARCSLGSYDAILWIKLQSMRGKRKKLPWSSCHTSAMVHELPAQMLFHFLLDGKQMSRGPHRKRSRRSQKKIPLVVENVLLLVLVHVLRKLLLYPLPDVVIVLLTHIVSAWKRPSRVQPPTCLRPPGANAHTLT